ncbi:MAG: pyridoxamine 5'-phosphate oxidase family protein [Tissierellia bacterium]|jgi:nitroimidazol reductase NimA-like FMN-containing flavoprotein (pyridoxamine 5'-phosphate oxidase superfamily)|nr:pyridoxamine 5'-phosphate oxidase family protein [Tissierellia bacterium]
MFRKMRRIKQLLSMEDTVSVLDRCTNGVMACLGDEDYPYAVPVNYVYYKDKIYFHSGKSGHKIDAIKKYPKVSFTVVDKDTIVSQEYTSYFRSVIAFGKARITEGDEWFEAFKALVEKYSGDMPKDAKHEKITECTGSHVIAIDIDHLTGKEAIELVNAKK